MKNDCLKLLFTMLLALAGVAASAAEYDFETDGIYYNILSEDDMTVEVTASPSIYGYEGSITVPPTVECDGKTYAVTAVGSVSFYGNSVDTIVMPSVTEVGLSAFVNCYSLRHVSMPSVTTVGDYAFYGCRALSSIEMQSVERVGNGAFDYCEMLTSVDLRSVTEIGWDGFYSCSSLTSLDLPATVTAIGDEAFARCSSLDTVRCHWTEPLACRPAFEPAVLDSATLYVPAGTKAAYEATAPWGGFKNIVEKNYSSITSTQSSAPSVTVIDGTIVIEGETDMAQPVEVYSTGGQCVHRGAGTRIEGLPHGVYVVKVGQGTAKVVL